MIQSCTTTIAITGTAVSLTAGIFVFDLLTPLGNPVLLLYLGSILLSLWVPWRAFPFIMAGLCSMLSGFGFFLAPPGVPISYGLMNRVIGVMVFWTAAVGVSTASGADAQSGRLVFGLSRRTVANLTSVGLIMILFVVMTYRMMVASLESAQLVAHTHEVLTELSLTLSTIKDAETGQRSFLLTGEDLYLELYERAVVDVHRHVDRLNNLTQDNPLQRARLLGFARMVEEKLAELRDTIAIRRSQGSDAALRILKTDHGKAVMDDLRHRVAQLEGVERDLLVQREQQAAILSHSQTVLVVLGGLALTGLMAATVLLLRREQLKQREIAAVMRLTLATLDATMDGAFVFDPRTLRFSHVNVGAVQQVGYSEEELLGMTPLDLKPEFDEPRFREMLMPLVRGAQSVHTFTTIHRRKDGVDIPVEINLQCVEAGTAQARLVAVARDITERQHAEEAQRRLAAIVEGTGDVIIGQTLDGIVTSWNHAAERLYGYAAEEIIGKPITLLLPPDRMEEEERIISCSREGTQVHSFETVRQTKDGRLIHLSLTISPIPNERGTVTGISEIARDITARKWVDEELKRQAQLLEATNKELKAFSYSVSHDLRAPLRRLEGLSLALLEDCSDRLDETGKDYLKRIRWEIERMGQLIEDLLRLALTVGAELRREPVDLSALAASRAEEARKQWSGRQVELVIDPGLKADGDYRLLGILLDNLLDNAWKFTRRRERAIVEVGAERLDGKTVYFVRDNGVGFDMAYAGKLFGVFQRLHAVTEYPGIGIGLALVQRIVHRHGGRVWAESTEGKGAAVYFTLS